MDDIKKVLVTTIGTVVKEGTTDTVDKKRKIKPNVVEEAITSPISKKTRLSKSTKQRNHNHPIKQLIHPKEIKPTQLNE